MDSFFEKIGIRGRFRANFGAIVMLAVAGCAIFGLPFFRFEYYSAYVDTYHLTNTQFGVFGTVIGVFGIVSYLFGGVVADGMPVRRIISGSLIITGVAGLFHLLPLNFYGLLVIYAVWGISTTFAFRPACVKAVRVMADDYSQGKAYGFFDGAQNVGGAVVAMIALAIFQWGTSNAGDQVTAMRMAIVFYSVVNIAMGIFAYIIMKGDRVTLRADRVTFEGIANVVKSPAVWIICLVAFCNHVFCLSVYYFIPFTTEVLGAAVGFGALLGVFRKWGGIIGNIGGGYLADKFGTGRLMLFAYACVLGCMLVLISLPVAPASIAIVAVLFIIALIMFNANVSVSWTMMTEGAIPVAYSGTAAGLICVAGALPETFASLMAGRIIDANPGVVGYHNFFYVLTGFVTLGFLMIIVWRIYLKRMRGKQEQVSAETAKAAMACGGGMRDTGNGACGSVSKEEARAAMACGGGLRDNGTGTCGGGMSKEQARAAMACGGGLRDMGNEAPSGECGQSAPADRLRVCKSNEDDAVQAGRNLLAGGGLCGAPAGPACGSDSPNAVDADAKAFAKATMSCRNSVKVVDGADLEAAAKAAMGCRCNVNTVDDE